eukprot:scpid107097/ scgid9988/ 
MQNTSTTSIHPSRNPNRNKGCKSCSAEAIIRQHGHEHKLPKKEHSVTHDTCNRSARRENTIQLAYELAPCSSATAVSCPVLTNASSRNRFPSRLTVLTALQRIPMHCTSSSSSSKRQQQQQNTSTERQRSRAHLNVESSL